MNPLLEVQSLNVEFPIYGGIWGRRIGSVQAVNNVSFDIQKGETLGLVGESGCGKSTLGRALLRLIEPSAGTILFQGKDIRSLDRHALRSIRRKAQIIFQDPFSSLNPRMRIRQILAEPLIIHGLCAHNEIDDRVRELLHVVGLRPESIDKFPHEFSGGQRQRIGIARALAVKPDFIVADEPVSALDVSIQSQILNLLKDLQKTFGLTYLFVSHDLNVVRYLCDRVMVMYLGRVMEILDRKDLQNASFRLHPYTEALLSAAPKSHPDEKRERIELPDDIPSPANPPSGCVFHPRCREADAECSKSVPPLLKDQSSHHHIACLKRPR